MNQVRVTESFIADWDMESDSLETALSESMVLGMSPPGWHVLVPWDLESKNVQVYRNS